MILEKRCFWERMADARALNGYTLSQELKHDGVVAKRGKPSLPKLKFMEGLGPEDPRFEPGTIIDDAGPVPDKVWEPFWEV